MDYAYFIASKHRRPQSIGVRVEEVTPYAKDFQAEIIRWALRKGRAALFEDCGLGKSIQELEWLHQLISRGHATRGLLMTPVAVGPQILKEAEKFQIGSECRIIEDASQVKSGINIINYEKLHKIDPTAFDAVVLDESSILKSFAGVTKRALCEAFRHTRFKLSATATPAPNDHKELGNQAEWLGIMPSNEMLSRWFINDTMKAGGYRLKNHARKDFWDWMASWSICMRKPSDIGFSDEGYDLPELNVIEHVIESRPLEGQLFATGTSVSATNVHREKRSSISDKAEQIANLVNNSSDAWSCWVDTNYEADALKELIPDAIEVRGSEPDKQKCEKLERFSSGQDRVIITKAEIAGFGLNWQHCCKTTYMAGFSFERWYQSIRRFYRFGQTRPVECHMFSSENEADVIATLKEKQAAAEEMSREMCEAMKSGMARELHGTLELRNSTGTKPIILPNWIKERNSHVAE